MTKAEIIGMGIYAPGTAISNDELKKLANIEFDAEKIEKKIGIKKRHIAKLRNIQESTADFATQAASAALKDAGIDPKDIGLFVVGTDTPEYISPSTALVVQGRIQGGENWGGAFDINASCASFTVAMDTVSKMMMSDSSIKYALVIGVYNMPAYIRPDDTFGYSIFADGAGAVVLKRSEGNSGYINGLQMSDGTQWNYIGIYSGGTKNPLTHEKIDNKEYGLQLLQPLPGDRNVRLWPMVVSELLKKANMELKDINHFFFTQINKSVIEKVMAILERPMSDTTCIMDQYGYTGSGCIPMAFYHAVKEQRVKKGHKVMFIASGAGLAVGGNIFTY